ncbi:Glycoprotein 3-alpha-L-fucosyltransferase A [Holothuria leucospilota]|uniref:Fucosyltransferase n=1 Tax=Holothuria leucospilota TaxID=206669 RepID=A0A9Q1BBX3_HOLLE|nr:Glycoprotein 3-alpha-L-fucosyltransferase A [Holothuria leucospilota]
MAEKKYKFHTVFVLLTLVLIFYFKNWQESKKFFVPVPITFRVANSPNLPVQKMNVNVSNDFRHIKMTNIPTDGMALFEPKFRHKNGNDKTTALQKLVSHVSIPLRVTHAPHSIPLRVSHSPNSTEEDKNNIDVRNIPTNRTTVEESTFSKSAYSKVFFNDTSKVHEFPSKKPCIKQIQLWANFQFQHFSEKEYDCPEENCKARYVHSNSYDKLKTSHAVILHHKGSWRWEDLARSRPDGQLWIYMTKESPRHSRKMIPDHHRLAYNWSMTYHTESDFVIPYGKYIEGIPEIHANDTTNWAAGKTRLIAWMASNCAVSSWSRMKFVRNLERLIQVDTYGRCGKLNCPRNELKCDEILSSHKFYLALENSECQDYITEKFWKNAFTHHLVPIVYGTTRKDYEKVAPPNSFVHLSDFRNMKSLVDYIKYLDKNDTAYNEYFEWRKRGSTKWYNEAQFASPESLLCPIVHKLRNIDDKNTKRTKMEPQVVNIQNWWRRSCMHRQSVWAT